MLIAVVQEDHVRAELDRGLHPFHAPLRGDDRDRGQPFRDRDRFVASFIRSDEGTLAARDDDHSLRPPAVAS